MLRFGIDKKFGHDLTQLSRGTGFIYQGWWAFTSRGISLKHIYDAQSAFSSKETSLFFKLKGGFQEAQIRTKYYQ